MTKLGIFVGEEIWTFFSEIYQDLQARYQIETFQKKIYTTPLFYGRLNRWSYQQGIRSILQNNDVCFFEWASEILMIASQMPKKSKIVTRLHSFELIDWAPEINWEAVDKVILVSQAMQNKFTALYPSQAYKTEVIYNGRPLNKFLPPEPHAFEFNLGMLGHIHPIKRVYEVILMIKTLRERGYKAHLHLAGEPIDKRYAASVYRLVDKLNLQPHITFYGHVKNTPAWLQMIDIFISNSYWEGQQVALIEAMASGCYCLSHFWDGVEEMLPPEYIYATEAELQQKIIAYQDASELEKRFCREQMRAIACERFDINNTIFQIRRVIEEAACQAH